MPSKLKFTENQQLVLHLLTLVLSGDAWEQAANRVLAESVLTVQCLVKTILYYAQICYQHRSTITIKQIRVCLLKLNIFRQTGILRLGMMRNIPLRKIHFLQLETKEMSKGKGNHLRTKHTKPKLYARIHIINLNPGGAPVFVSRNRTL